MVWTLSIQQYVRKYGMDTFYQICQRMWYGHFLSNIMGENIWTLSIKRRTCMRYMIQAWKHQEITEELEGISCWNIQWYVKWDRSVA